MREIIKREVSKLILAVFIYANLSPAVVCGKAYYHVVVERSRIGEGYTARIDKKGEDGNYRRLIEERPLNAFRETSDVSDRSKVNIEELLQKIRFKERIETYGGGGTLDPSEDGSMEELSALEPEQEREGEVSRGYVLDIDEIKGLLITSEGNVVFDTNEIKKSIKITTPGYVVLNDVKAEKLKVESSAVILLGRTEGTVGALHLKGIELIEGEGEDEDNSLRLRRSLLSPAQQKRGAVVFVDKESKLAVGNMTMEGGILWNDGGLLQVSDKMELNEGGLYNGGTISAREERLSSQVSLEGVSYMVNWGTISSRGNNLVIGANNATNLPRGTIRGKNITMNVVGAFGNKGKIETREKISIYGDEVKNEGVINGNSGTVEIFGKLFQQMERAEILATDVKFISENTGIQGGTVRGQEGLFNGEATIGIRGQVEFGEGKIRDGVLCNLSNSVSFNVLRLTGKMAAVQNFGTIKTIKIINDSEDGKIRSVLQEKFEAEEIRISSGGKLQLEARMSGLRDVLVEKGGELAVEEERQFESRLGKLVNEGKTSINSATKFESIHNGILAKLFLYDRVDVGVETRKATRTTAGNEVVLLNKGDIEVVRRTRAGLVRDRDYADLNIIGEYEGTGGSRLGVKGKVVARRYNNRGTIFSRGKLRVVSRTGWGGSMWGDLEAQESIIYEVMNGGQNNIDLSNRLIMNPMIKGANGRFEVKTDGRASVNLPFVHEEIDLKIEAEKGIDVRGELKVKGLEARTNAEFTVTGYIGSKGNLEIIAGNFSNNGGKIEVSGNATINVGGGTFKNGGGEETSEEIRDLIWWTKADPFHEEGVKTPFGLFKEALVCRNGGTWWIVGRYMLWEYASKKSIVDKENGDRLCYVRLVKHKETRRIGTSRMNMTKAGRISCLGELTVKGREINNDFGILHSGRLIKVIEAYSMSNRGGIMLGTGGVDINSWGFFNEMLYYMQKKGAVDPDKPKTGKILLMRMNYKGKKEEEVIIDYDEYPDGYFPIREAAFPGCVYSEGDINVNAMSLYPGSLTSTGGNIRIRGEGIQLGTGNLVAKESIDIILGQLRLDRLRLQSQNVQIIATGKEGMVVGGYASSLSPISPSERGIRLIDLEELSTIFNFALRGREEGRERTISPFSCLMVSSVGSAKAVQTAVGEAALARSIDGIMSPSSVPSDVRFASTVSDVVMVKLLELIITPVYGYRESRQVNVDLIGSLEEAGRTLSFVYRKGYQMPEDGLAIVYKESEKSDDDSEDGGVRRFKPYLLVKDAIEDLERRIEAENVNVSSEADMLIRPVGVRIDTKNLRIEGRRVRIESEYIRNIKADRRGVTPAALTVGQSLTIVGREGIEQKAVMLKSIGGDIEERAVRGDIKDEAMPTDGEEYKVGRAYVRKGGVCVSKITGEAIRMEAEGGDIIQEGTVMTAGKRGMRFRGRRHEVRPAYFEESAWAEWESGDRSHSEWQRITTPVGAELESQGDILFQSEDTTLIGAKITTQGGVRSLERGNIAIRGARGKVVSHSEDVVEKERWGGLFSGESRMAAHVEEEIYLPAVIEAKEFESKGIGLCELEGVIAKVAEMSIEKRLVERSGRTTKRSKVVESKRGWLPPRIKGDPFLETTRALRKTVTVGDAIPNAMNVVGAGAQTLTHIEKLRHLQQLGNPLWEVAKIMGSRYVGHIMYSRQKTTTKQVESVPKQSRLDVGILRISNDRTHLEGKWRVDDAEITTGKLEAKAAKREVRTERKVRGHSISFSPVAGLAAAVAPGAASIIGAMPIVEVNESDKLEERTSWEGMELEATERLYIRCGAAVFSGSNIRGKVVDMVVEGTLTLETLRNTFRKEVEERSVGASLAGIFGAVTEFRGERSIMSLKDAPLPTMRIAEEKEVRRKIDAAARLIGTEKFYLKVGALLYNEGGEIGLLRDGEVVRKRRGEARTGELTGRHDPCEVIDALLIVNKSVREIRRHHKSSFRPSLGELTSMLGQIDEYRQVKAQFVEQCRREEASVEQIARDAKGVYEEAKRIREELARRKKETQDKLNGEIPPKKEGQTEDALENLCDAIFDEQTSKGQLVAFMNTVREAEASEQQFLMEQKARIAASKTLGARARQFLDEYINHTIIEYEQEVESLREQIKTQPRMLLDMIPVLPGIGEALANYNEGEISGEEAVMFALKRAASDAVLWYTGGKVVKVVRGLGKAAKAVSRVVKDRWSRGGALQALSEKLGVTVEIGEGRINWAEPFKERGLNYEGKVLSEASLTGEGEKFMGYTRTPVNAETYDAVRFADGKAVSIKSLKTTERGYKEDARRVRYRINSYIRDILSFKKIERKEFIFRRERLKVPELYVGVPEETTMEQFMEIKKSIDIAKEHGITFTLRIEK